MFDFGYGISVLTTMRQAIELPKIPDPPPWAVAIAKIVVPIFVMSLVFWIVMVILRTVRERRIKLEAETPVFKDIAKACALSMREQLLVLKAAEKLNLGNNINLFTRPSLWDTFIERATSRRDCQYAIMLKAKIFGFQGVTGGGPEL